MVDDVPVLGDRPARAGRGTVSRRQTVRATLVACDALGLWQSALLVDGLVAPLVGAHGNLAPALVPLLGCSLTALALQHAYASRPALLRTRTVAAPEVWRGLVLTGAVLFFVAPLNGGASKEAVLLWLATGLLLVLVLRSLGLHFLTALRPQRVLLVRVGEGHPTASGRLGSIPGIRVVASLQVRDPRAAGSPDRLEELSRLLGTVRLDHVVVLCPEPTAEAVRGLRALQRRVDVSVVPGAVGFLSRRCVVEERDGLAVLHGGPSPGLSHAAAKRALDVAVSACCLVLLAPLFAVLAVAIRRSSPGPALFRQARTGRGGRPFTMLKFRTMHEGAAGLRDRLAGFNQAEPPLFKLEPDPRATPLGRRLRRTHLDELPQLVNVLLGQMSLVGPRPLPLEEAACLSRLAPLRHEVRPGITGPWQVSGGIALSTADLCYLDESYAATPSLADDFRILARTARMLLRPRDSGAAADPRLDLGRRRAGPTGEVGPA